MNDEVLQTILASEADLAADLYPHLYNISPAFMYQFLPVLNENPVAPEYVYVPVEPARRRPDGMEMRLEHFISLWNSLWEAGPARGEHFGDDLPPDLGWLRTADRADLRLVPLTGANRYPAYATLYHLLPRATLEHFGLPLLRQGNWPGGLYYHNVNQILPVDVDARIAEAFSFHVWPLLMGRSRPSAFSDDDPIRILAHNLDFWMPHADRVAQERLRTWGRVPIDDDEQALRLQEIQAETPPGTRVERPLFGGSVWMGEDEAWQATRRMLDFADENGRLRGILDAVRSHREHDDFSDRWSFAKEDFERKLYRKRLKTRVTFIELDETVPVIGPESEVHERLLWEDFMAFLDQKEKRVVVLLRSGVTRVGEIAAEMGYANHSPVSKALERIRRKALRFLEVD